MFFVFIEILVSTDNSLAKYTGDPGLSHHVLAGSESPINYNYQLQSKVTLSCAILLSLSFE